MPRSCNKSLIVHSYYFSSGVTYDVLGPCPAPSPPSVRHHFEHFWVHGWVWKNVFPRFVHKKQSINLQTHSAVNHGHIYEAGEIVKGNPAVGTSGGREALASLYEGHFSAGSFSAGSPAGNGQKNNDCKLVRVTGGVQSQSSLFYLVDFSRWATLLPVMIYGDL